MWKSILGLGNSQCQGTEQPERLGCRIRRIEETRTVADEWREGLVCVGQYLEATVVTSAFTLKSDENPWVWEV